MSQRKDNLTVQRGIFYGIFLTLIVFVTLYIFIPHLDYDPGLLSRIKLGIKCLVFPALFFVVLIIRIGSQRFGNPAEDPTRVLASSHSMEVDLRVLANTHEQLSIFIINVMALSILLPFPYLTLLPIYSGIFIFGRLVFWLGYRHNPLLRALGFALNILPALAGLIYCAIALIWLSA